MRNLGGSKGGIFPAATKWTHAFILGTNLIITLVKSCVLDLDHPLSSASETGSRLNIKTVLSTYGDFHVKDKTAVRTTYL